MRIVVPTLVALNAYFHISGKFSSDTDQIGFSSLFKFLIAAPIIAVIASALFMGIFIVAGGVVSKDPTIAQLLGIKL
jgi:hypothetical protein